MPLIDDDEYAAVLALECSQSPTRREYVTARHVQDEEWLDNDAALREMVRLPCPYCEQIDSPAPGTPPLRLTLRRQHGRPFLTCPRWHEFRQARDLREAMSYKMRP